MPPTMLMVMRSYLGAGIVPVVIVVGWTTTGATTTCCRFEIMDQTIVATVVNAPIVSLLVSTSIMLSIFSFDDNPFATRIPAPNVSNARIILCMVLMFNMLFIACFFFLFLHLSAILTWQFF